ncbi:MAG: efflux RND transporter periplasmic adaptor subunit [Verrucomicrobia bacterium]|nr:efflux RND transporter periplasmic adaptor subunit [Verrucomicrobiota bacterium]
MPNPKLRSRKKVVVVSSIAVVAIAAVVVVFLRKREAPITIQTDKVTRRDITELVVANGRIHPVLQVKISPEVSGEIIELPVKEGQPVKKGDLLLRIKPDFYIANVNQAEASFKSSVADKGTSEANLAKAEAEFKRNEELYQKKLISESAFFEIRTAHEIAKSSLQSATHRVEMSNAMLARAQEELAKTTIRSPLTGTVSKLNSELGERVVGTAQMAGTDVMTVADLNEMEARVDVGEIDVVLIAAGQKARLEVDAFKDRKFAGTVTEIANSSKGMGLSGMGGGGGQQQEATRFEVKIRIQNKEPFRPGMSVTAEIETRSRTNVLAVPIQAVTVRLPKEPKDGQKPGANLSANRAAVVPGSANPPASTGTNSASKTATNSTPTPTNALAKPNPPRKPGDPPKPIEVVFGLEGDRAKMLPVKIGISDDSFMEITEGLSDGQEIISGGYKAVSRELEEGKKTKKGPPAEDKNKEKK